jgi:hypothetical protein
MTAGRKKIRVPCPDLLDLGQRAGTRSRCGVTAPTLASRAKGLCYDYFGPAKIKSRIMGRVEKTVFISYRRRTDEPWGLAIFQDRARQCV